MTRKKTLAKKKQAQAAANGQTYVLNHCVQHQLTSSDSKNPLPSERPSSPTIPIPQGPCADDVKEQGNVAFKAKQYTEAIELYTKAIGTAITTTVSFFTDTNTSQISNQRNHHISLIAQPLTWL
jgi:DnaJ family protein C protein 7